MFSKFKFIFRIFIYLFLTSYRVSVENFWDLLLQCLASSLVVLCSSGCVCVLVVCMCVCYPYIVVMQKQGLHNSSTIQDLTGFDES